MAFLLSPTMKPLTYGLGLALTTTTLYHALPSSNSPLARRHLLHCDTSISSSSPKDWSFSQYTSEARTPVVRKDGKLNPGAVSQIARGSIVGVVCGLAVSVFSRSLALLFGLAIVGIQFAESRGIHIIPYNRLQGYFKNVDLRSLVQDNAAFKLSFGATFALAGFAQLD